MRETTSLDILWTSSVFYWDFMWLAFWTSSLAMILTFVSSFSSKWSLLNSPKRIRTFILMRCWDDMKVDRVNIFFCKIESCSSQILVIKLPYGIPTEWFFLQKDMWLNIPSIKFVRWCSLNNHKRTTSYFTIASRFPCMGKRIRVSI